MSWICDVTIDFRKLISNLVSGLVLDLSGVGFKCHFCRLTAIKNGLSMPCGLSFQEGQLLDRSEAHFGMVQFFLILRYFFYQR